MNLTRTQREIIGRATMLLFFGLLPLWGGVKCIRTARWMDDDFARQHLARSPSPKEHSGSGLPFTIGLTLLVIGGFFTLAALLPVASMEALIGPPRRTTLWTDPKPDPPLDRVGYWD